jgi:cytoskeletal protein RodZ
VADNNTRGTRVKTLGIFAAIALVLFGLSAAGLYFARQRSEQLATASQNQAATNNQGEKTPATEQKPDDSQDNNDAGAPAIEQPAQDNQPDQSGSTQPPAQDQPAPQPQPQAQPAPAPAQAQAQGTVPATGPAEMAILTQAGLLSVVTYGVARMVSRRQKH